MCSQLRTQVVPKCTLLRTRVKEEKGAEMVEAALILPLVLMLLIGTVWVGLAFNVYQAITHAAREGARFAVAPTCATCGNIVPTDDEIRAVINNSLSAAGVDPASTNPNPIPVLRDQLLTNPGNNPEERGVVIAFRYPFQLVIPFTAVHLTTVNIPTQVQMREE